MLNLKEKYEELKNNPDILVDCDEITAFFLDYYKERVRLANTKIPHADIREFISDFGKIYEETEDYKETKSALEKLPFIDKYEIQSELDARLISIRTTMRNNAMDSRDAAIYLLNLIDHIAHYKPVEVEERIGDGLRNVDELEEYDIKIITSKDGNKFQIMSEDVVRLISTAKHRIYRYDLAMHILNNREEIIKRLNGDPERLKRINECWHELVYDFPKSRRKEIREAELEEKYQKIKERYFR